MKITAVKAIQVLDSRGNPTVRTFVMLDDGSTHSSSVPSGASTGKYEAVELRDNDPKKFLGQSVERAVANVNGVIAKEIIAMDINDPEKIDRKMIEMDGTENKSSLGANAILSVSQAMMKAGAYTNHQPLWKFINEYYFKGVQSCAPRLMVNIINGGKHANWNFDIQEFMISPLTNKPSGAVRIAGEIFYVLGEKLKEMKLSALVGDEGGYSPPLESNEKALEMIIAAAESLSYRNGIDYGLALDSAASEFFVDDKYVFKKSNQSLTGKELANYYLKLQERFQIFSFEDPFAQDDWDNFAKFMGTGIARNAPTMIIGDDLYTTNVKRIKKGEACQATNAVLIKPNQIGTVYETIEAIKETQAAGWKIIISHRSGETEDSFIADLAYAAADFIKTGSMSRSERLAKYNRLIEIENKL